MTTKRKYTVEFKREGSRECRGVDLGHRCVSSSTDFDKPYNFNNCNSDLFSISGTFGVKGEQSGLAPPISGRYDEKDVVTLLRVIQT